MFQALHPALLLNIGSNNWPQHESASIRINTTFPRFFIDHFSKYFELAGTIEKRGL